MDSCFQKPPYPHSSSPARPVLPRGRGFSCPSEGAALGLTQPQNPSSCLACAVVISASNHGGSDCAPDSTDIITAPVYRCRNGDSERLGDLPKATERKHRKLNPSLPDSRV